MGCSSCARRAAARNKRFATSSGKYKQINSHLAALSRKFISFASSLKKTAPTVNVQVYSGTIAQFTRDVTAALKWAEKINLEHSDLNQINLALEQLRNADSFLKDNDKNKVIAYVRTSGLMLKRFAGEA